MNTKRILIPLMFFLAGTVLHAQYSNEAFEQKRAGELYDERGFLQNKAITVDGKLVVSNSNGNVSYSYPLTAWKESGYDFSASLNYCGSVAFTTFGEYDHENMESPYSAWDRFTQNRPVWLLGVNGFAVQAVSYAASFHAHPDWITGRYENGSITSFDDEDFVWAIDGYDICNRMQDFAAGSFDEGQGTNPYRYRDVIRLLRADGSVLELLNISYEQSGAGGSDVWGVSGHLYSGYYVVNEANAQGYAWVEYQDTADLPFYLNDFLPDAPRYRPRIVHYYPGDGLEYIFKEWFNPFGMQDLLDANLQFGGAKANPTIFYLMEIRSAGKHLLNFYYSRHREVDYGFDQGYYPVYDSTKGRALLTGFGESAVSYGDGWMAVKTDGRTTVVRFDTVSFSGNANPSQSFPLATMGYLGSVSQAVAEFPLDEDGQYASWLGYVTSITDPEGRRTVFDYEQYERRHWDFGFPRGDVTVILKNYRLNEIIEPTAKYAIKYHNRGGGYESFDVEGLDTLTVRQGYVGDYPYAFSNSAWEVEKRTLAGGLLTTDSYDFIFGSAPMETVPTGASVVTEDNLSGRSTTTNSHYTRHKLPRGIQLTPDKYYTALDKVETFGYVNSVKTDSTVQTTSYTNPAPYLWLPSSQRQTAGAAVQAYTAFTYGLDTVRRYGDDDTLIKYHGMEVGTTVSYTIDPLDRTHRVDSTIYLNIPEFDTSFTYVDTVLDKFAMAQNFINYSSDPQQYPDFADVEYVDVYYDPRIRVVKYLDTISVSSYKLPPLFGLVAETSTYDGNGNYLRGKKNSYCLQGDCDAGTSALTWFEGLNLIGALISDTIYGRNRAMIPGTRIFYDRTERGMPDYVQNSVGARTRNYYDYRHPGIDTSEQPTGLMFANDDEAYEQALRNSTYYAFRHELPQSTRTEVRRYDPWSGPVIPDKL